MSKHLTGSREEFDAWIRDTIGGDFRWKIRPRDTPSNRKMVADLILIDIENGGGVFPASNAFMNACSQSIGAGNTNQESTDSVQCALRIAGLTSSFTVYPDVDAVIEALSGDD